MKLEKAVELLQEIYKKVSTSFSIYWSPNGGR